MRVGWVPSRSTLQWGLGDSYLPIGKFDLREGVEGGCKKEK